MVYEPREDSFLLQKEVLKYARGKCLDIGTGSGIQAKAALKNGELVVALDIDDKAVEEAKKHLGKRAVCAKSDLFEFFEKKKYSKIRDKRLRKILSGPKFDTIIFNPPYLPEDARLKDITLDGGKKGYEILEKFFSNVNSYLAPDGIILIVFSSLTNKSKVDEIIKGRMLEREQLSMQRIFFEELYVYRIKKSALLKELEKKGVTGIKFLARGKRGVVFTGTFKGRKIAIKAKKKESMAIGRIENEANYLKLLNKKGIGPKFIFAGDGYLCYEFVNGKFIVDYLEKCSKAQAKSVLKALFKQLYVLDQLKVDKEEMHHPFKHIIVGKKAVMIDFERCHKTLAPKNVTQFLQFVSSDNLSSILKKKGISISRQKAIRLAKQYKKDYSRNVLKIF